MTLSQQKCVPCEGGFPPLTQAKAQEQLKQLSGWELTTTSLTKTYTFSSFVESMKFVQKVADLAEREGHHPDIYISYNIVTLTLTTHAIKGLSVNDFIVAAKVDVLR